MNTIPAHLNPSTLMQRLSTQYFSVACLLPVMLIGPTLYTVGPQRNNSRGVKTAADVPEGLAEGNVGTERGHIHREDRFESGADEAETVAATKLTISSSIVLSGYCVLIVAASLFGGWLPSLIQLTHTRMQTIVSFVGGLMLGIGVFHLIPHAEQQLGDMDSTMLWMMCGILLMFFLIRTFHFHNHGIAEETQEEECDPCVQDHSHSHSHVHSHPHAHRFSWVGIVVGLSIHTLLDGIALGSAVSNDSAWPAVLPGIGVFLAVLLHKPLDAVSVTTLMSAGGWDRRKVLAVNAGFAMMCPLGAALFLMGINRFPGLQQELAGAAMAFSAGVFLCIALSDLLPEMEFHSHHRLRLSVALSLGVLTAWAIRHMHG